MIPSNASLQNKDSCNDFSAFFRKGQVIETFRDACIYQPAVNLAIEELRAGAWVRVLFFPVVRSRLLIDLCSETARSHGYIDSVFAEGEVCQSDTYMADLPTGIARFQRFKRGMCAQIFYFITSQTTEAYPRPPYHAPHTNHKNVVLTLPFRSRYHANRPPSAGAL